MQIYVSKRTLHVASLRTAKRRQANRPASEAWLYIDRVALTWRTFWAALSYTDDGDDYDDNDQGTDDDGANNRRQVRRYRNTNKHTKSISLAGTLWVHPWKTYDVSYRR